MNPTSTNSGLVPNESPDFVIDESAKSVWLGAQRCHLGDTDQFSLMLTLGLYRNCPVEHVRMLREIDRSDLSPNELRRIVYRLKQRLRKYGLAEVADAIRNVRGAYMFEWTKEVTFQGTDTQERTMENGIECQEFERATPSEKIARPDKETESLRQSED